MDNQAPKNEYLMKSGREFLQHGNPYRQNAGRTGLLV
jgi:hypothetical protein